MMIPFSALTIVGLMKFLIMAAIVILAIIFLIKGIKYLNRWEEQDVRQNCQRAQDTIDEIERELNDRKKDW